MLECMRLWKSPQGVWGATGTQFRGDTREELLRNVYAACGEAWHEAVQLKHWPPRKKNSNK